SRACTTSAEFGLYGDTESGPRLILMLLLAAAIYVGNLACQPCHTQLVNSYRDTPMARSSGRVEAVADASFTAAGHRYRIAGNRLEFDGGSAPLDFFVGSATLGRSYLFQRDGFLFQLPVSWYAQKQLWDASPGYENEPEVRLS